MWRLCAAAEARADKSFFEIGDEEMSVAMNEVCRRRRRR
jgi:hypothetical protein